MIHDSPNSVNEMSPNQDCIRDCNRDFPKCESDCDLNQFLILGRTDFPTYEANGITDEIVEFKNFQYHHHEVDMERVQKYYRCFIRSFRNHRNDHRAPAAIISDRNPYRSFEICSDELKISLFY